MTDFLSVESGPASTLDNPHMGALENLGWERSGIEPMTRTQAVRPHTHTAASIGRGIPATEPRYMTDDYTNHSPSYEEVANGGCGSLILSESGSSRQWPLTVSDFFSCFHSLGRAYVASTHCGSIEHRLCSFNTPCVHAHRALDSHIVCWTHRSPWLIRLVLASQRRRRRTAAWTRCGNSGYVS